MIGYKDDEPLWARDAETGHYIKLIIEDKNEKEANGSEVHEVK